MPTYEFRCPIGHEFEKFYRSIGKAEAEVACPDCGQIAERMMSAGAGLVFKGSGFYLTDYGKNAHLKKNPADAKSEGGSSDGGSTEGAKGDASKGDGSKGDGAKSDASKSEASAGSSAAGGDSGSAKGGGPKSEGKSEPKASDPKPAPSKPKPGTGE